MFLSKNRYGRSWYIEHCLKEDTLWPQYFSGVQLGRTGNLIHQFPLPEVEEYYEDDQFYTQHVQAKEWFEKEHQEYNAGLWDSYFEYLISRMNPDLPLLDVGCGAGWFIDHWNFKITEQLIELRNMVLVAELIIESAINRKESRGTHYSIDYPKKLNIAKDTILKKPKSKKNK